MLDGAASGADDFICILVELGPFVQAVIGVIAYQPWCEDDRGQHNPHRQRHWHELFNKSVIVELGGHLIHRHAGTVEPTNNRTNTCAGNHVNWYALFEQDFENTDVSSTT